MFRLANRPPLDWIDASWVDDACAELVLEVGMLAHRTIPYLSGQGRHSEARYFSKLLTSRDPLDEQAARTSMKASAQAGRFAESEQTFHDLAQALDDEL